MYPKYRRDTPFGLCYHASEALRPWKVSIKLPKDSTGQIVHMNGEGMTPETAYKNLLKATAVEFAEKGF